MNIETEHKNGALIVRFRGEIDHSVTLETREILDSIILKGGFDYVVFDFKNVDFMDSAGIGLIMGRYKKLGALNKCLYVKNINPAVDKILRISGIYKLVKAI